MLQHKAGCLVYNNFATGCIYHRDLHSLADMNLDSGGGTWHLRLGGYVNEEYKLPNVRAMETGCTARKI